MFADRLAVRSLESLADMDAVVAEWRALEQRAAAPLSFFQSHDWCRTWAAEFASGGGHVRPFVQTLWCDGALAAVWPLALSEGAVQRATTLGGAYSQYSNLIHDPKLVSEADLAAFVSHVLKPGRFDVAVLDAVPGSSPLARLISTQPGSVICAGNESLMLDLGGWIGGQEFSASQSRSRRRGLERRRKQFERIGPIGFEVIWPDHPDFPSMARRTIEMKRVWLKETGRISSGGGLTGWGNFLACLSGSEADRRGACISIMRVGDRIVALEVGLLQDGHYYSHIGAFDWEFAPLSPGKLQLDLTLRWLVDNGAQTYDFLANVTDYKRAWSNRSEPLTDYAVPLSWKGRIYAEAWLPALKPSIKRVFYAMPASLRRAVA